MLLAATETYQFTAFLSRSGIAFVDAMASRSHTEVQVAMGGYSTLSGGYVTTSDTVNSAVHKIEDLLLWYELN